MHKLRIKHGNITVDTVFAKRRSKGLEVKLGGFDKAVVLTQPKRKGSSSLLVLTQKIARQVNDEVTLTKSDDIFDVGILIYLLLNDVSGNDESDYKTVLSCKAKD